MGVGEQESHLIQQVIKEDAVGKIAISTYSKDQNECHRINTLIKEISSNIEIEFFDSQSEGCWNNPDSI